MRGVLRAQIGRPCRDVPALLQVKFAGEVTPDIKKVTYKVDMKRVINRRLVMGIGDAVLEADGNVIYTAQDLRVGLYQR